MNSPLAIVVPNLGTCELQNLTGVLYKTQFVRLQMNLIYGQFSQHGTLSQSRDIQYYGNYLKQFVLLLLVTELDRSILGSETGLGS